MKVIITGGTGLIGRALANNLADDGHEVIILSRSPEKYAGKFDSKQISLERWDAKTAAGWGRLADGADAIVNLAGESLSGGFPPKRWTPARKQRFWESRINAANAVREAIEAAENKPKMVLQSSAVGYYGPQDDTLITEAAEAAPDYLAQLCMQWEDAIKPVERLGVRVTAIRTGLVMSLEDGAFPPLLLPFKLFAGGPMGNGEQYYSWIHIDDQIRAMRYLMENESASGAFNLTAPTPQKNKDMAKIIGNVMRRPSFVPVPGLALKLAFGEVSTIILDGQRVIPEKLEAHGFEFKYTDFEAALRALLGK